jgi:hypothetical protein
MPNGRSTSLALVIPVLAERGGTQLKVKIKRPLPARVHENYAVRRFDRFAGQGGETYSSRSNVTGSTDIARRAGIQVAKSPSTDIAMTTPASTNGSRGVAS